MTVKDTSKRNDGGSAFPKYFGANRDLAPGEESGMSLRDYFAGQALIAIGRNYGDLFGKPTFREEVRKAYACADAMLAERAK